MNASSRTYVTAVDESRSRLDPAKIRALAADDSLWHDVPDLTERQAEHVIRLLAAV